MKKIILSLIVILTAVNVSAQEPVTKLITAKDVGNTIALSIRVSRPEYENLVWIDLNGNGIKDAGEQVTKFREKVDYTINTQEINIYGPVWVLDCTQNEISSMDISKNAANLSHLYCGYNLLTEIDLSNNPKLSLLSCFNNNITQIILGQKSGLKTLNCYRNQIDATSMLKLINSLPAYSSSNPGEFIISSNNRKEKNEISDSLISLAKVKGWNVVTMVGTQKQKM